MAGRMVEMTGREGKFKVGGWEFKFHWVGGIEVSGPSAQRLLGVYLTPTALHPQNPASSGTVRRAVKLRGRGSLFSHWRRWGCGGGCRCWGAPPQAASSPSQAEPQTMFPAGWLTEGPFSTARSRLTMK